MLCREDGGVLDDLFTYRLADDRFLTVTNAANHEQRPRVVRSSTRPSFDVDVHDRADDYAMLAVQGPEARGIVRALADGELPDALPRCQRDGRRRARLLVCGTGYTGEDGVELLLDADRAPQVWDARRRGGRDPGRASARATRCAWRSASTSTATT